MKILLLGGGGREHAIGWSLTQSDQCEKLYIAPGNAGTEQIGENVDLKEDDFDQIKEFVLKENIELVVVGPEKPLVNGIVDYFKNNPSLSSIPVLGPDQEAAQLEGSKSYAKQFMKRHGIPTGGFASFQSEEIEKAKEAIENQRPPYVIKADGLASGKGVVICEHKEEAMETLEDYFVKEKLGGAGKNVVLEEYLDGEELSIFILTDGKEYVMLPNARDYKRVGEGDTGPNTGGMGAISPVPGLDDQFLEKVEKNVVKPTLDGIQKEKLNYTGFLYFGLIKVNNEPYVLEYNVRLGDPETEVVLPRIQGDLCDVIHKTVNGNLSNADLSLKKEAGATVVIASGGYPGSYEKGKEISGLDKVDNAWVFHAGTKKDSGKIVTSGGRVVAVTGLGESLEKALEVTYQNVEKISFEKAFYRKDIGGAHGS